MKPFSRGFLIAAVILALPVAVWFRLVQDVVPSPYLDEVFHVRQATHYTHGRFHIWDPKITTPPGLYLASYAYLKFLRAINVISNALVKPPIFRSINAIGSICLAAVVSNLLLLIKQKEPGKKLLKVLVSWHQPSPIHTIINICLFPPLFFFYGLYYTDVLSALSVLFAYQCYLERTNDWVCISAGLVSLLFRQTNIFWVSLFVGGLAFCRAIPEGRTGDKFSDGHGFLDVIQFSWQNACCYDPPISQALFEDYIKCCISYGIAGLVNILKILKALTPCLAVLTAIIGFVFWNGGVVLGDKENHIVSIHLAQMLYIWPYIVFFSIPLLYPHILNLMISHKVLPSALHSNTIKSQTPRLIVAIPTIASMLAIVHYNTLIHPFTLADNRHYTFYVFRILLRHPALKYLAVPIYFLCAWASIAILSSSGTSSTRHPNHLSPRKRSKQPIYKSPQAPKRSPPDPESPTGGGPKASFLLIWLLATAASVVTAPLVEPRYFIVPWLIWRIHVADAMTPATHDDSNVESAQDAQPAGYDYRLWFETAWFLCINVVIGYVFLYRGFKWPQEPGVVQRFMW